MANQQPKVQQPLDLELYASVGAFIFDQLEANGWTWQGSMREMMANNGLDSKKEKVYDENYKFYDRVIQHMKQEGLLNWAKGSAKGRLYGASPEQKAQFFELLEIKRQEAAGVEAAPAGDQAEAV